MKENTKFLFKFSFYKVLFDFIDIKLNDFYIVQL